MHRHYIMQRYTFQEIGELRRRFKGGGVGWGEGVVDEGRWMGFEVEEEGEIEK
jgi:hypothetical protein